MNDLDAALVTSALVLTVAGAALGLRGCAHRGVRAWTVHLVASAAMLAMLVPAPLSERLGAPSPALWPLVLVVALLWTVADGVRSRARLARRLPAVELATLALAARGRLREAVDLAAMALLALGMAAPATPTSSTTAPHAHAHAGEPLAVLLGWGVALAAFTAQRGGHDRWGLAGSLGMLGAMALMATGHAAG